MKNLKPFKIENLYYTAIMLLYIYPVKKIQKVTFIPILCSFIYKSLISKTEKLDRWIHWIGEFNSYSYFNKNDRKT